MYRFNHFNFNVRDLEKSLAFYQDVLGFREVRRKENKEKGFIIVYLGDGVTDFQLELTWLADHPQPYDLGEQEFHLALVTDRYEQSYKEHKEKNLIIFENAEMGIYFLEDPDGYWVEIIPPR